MKIAIVSLGCPKNQVDADRFCHALIKAGHETVADTSQAECVIVNTCGFIQSAKEEAIEEIFNACALKKLNPKVRVVVTGCLAERYREELAREIPELDAVVGIGSTESLPGILETLAAEVESREPLQAYGPKADLPLEGPRIISTPRHYAWLKIAEGCSNVCAYCAIPAIRGPLRSRRIDAVVQEAEWLAQQGVRELVLVAQDVTAYGNDQGECWLVPLLKRLDGVEGIHWIRLLYAYPEKIDETLLQAMAESEKVLPYLDIPIQHCNDTVLQAMGRKGDAAAVQRAIELVREMLPGATLRTTLIAGFPGESEAQFEELCRFVEESRFDRLGCFAYSAEEGTRAEKMPGQLPEEVKAARADTIMQLQSRVMMASQEAMAGKELEVVCDAFDEEEQLWLCRSAADAPEIDANVLVGGGPPMVPGMFYNVRVTGADGVDLTADVLGLAE